MIITEDDLRQAHNVVADLAVVYLERRHGERVLPMDPVLFAERPHLLMVLGYDDFRAVEGSVAEEEVSRSFKINEYIANYDYESVYRDGASGAWYWYVGMSPESLFFAGPRDERFRESSVGEWLKLLRSLQTRPDPAKRTLWLPGIWTPQAQVEQRASLGDTVGDLIQAVQGESRSLREIPWRQLEELIAELLRSRGLQIFVTPRSGDGGRDIIARGELIPGEPMLLAVEVKQKAVVGLAEVQRALRANEDFPALMLATAGRFSAGVIQERDRARNKLRLFLKDGIALTQWIEAYPYMRKAREFARTTKR